MTSSFFLVPALVALRDETNERYPRRDRSSDGWIGDPSHAARVSDHNPCWGCPEPLTGAVRAIDLDITPDGDPDDDLRLDLLAVTVGDPRVWYVISNGRIYSRTHGWEARVYTGNQHTGHVHVSAVGNPGSGVSADAARRLNLDTSPWWDKPKGTRLPAVRLHRLIEASRYPGKVIAPGQVKRTQRALAARSLSPGAIDGRYGPRTRGAYASWQRRIGFVGQDADGLPGLTSLTALGAGRFRVTR